MIHRSYFFLLGDLSGSDLKKVRFRIRYNGETVAFGLGLKVNPEKWSRSTQRCVKSSTHGPDKIPASAINAEIYRYEKAADGVFDDFDRSGIMPSADEFRAAFRVAIGRDDPAPRSRHVLDVFDEFVIKMGAQNAWTPATHTKFRSIRMHLLAYGSDRLMDEVSDAWLQGFLTYFHSVPLRNSTIMKMVGFLRWFLRWAYGAGYYSGRCHESFRPKMKGTDGNSKDIVFLSWEELMALYKYSFPPEMVHLDRVRDVFCFCCFTGLRFSDVFKLKRCDVFDKEIRVVTQKTADSLVIELNKYSRAILDKYAGFTFAGNRALPVLSNPRMNYEIKDACRVVGIDTPQREVYFLGSDRVERVRPKYECITMHAARRTFVVAAIYLGVPAEVVMSWTGHSDYSAMKPYVSIVEKLKSREMEKFNRD